VTKIIAHRGASKAEPENTVAAYRRARAMGADMVELDVRRTADGTLAVHHDPHLPDGRAVLGLTRASLPRGMPDLATALDACEGMEVNVEIKNDPGEADFDPGCTLADAVVELARARGELDRILVSSFDLATIDRVRAIEPALATAWLVVDLPPDGWAAVVDHGHRALHPWVDAVTPEMIAHAHALGVAVNTWTCDDPDRMVELAEWGIDGICTNVPDVAVACLRPS
jgi:glycerophosphoryl diester phosphodiesterase